MLDVREKLDHIDQMLADHDRERRESRYAIWFAVLTTGAASFAAGATLFAAGATFMKFLQ